MIFPKVGIVLLNWNGKKDSIECIDSINKMVYSNYQLFIVDNGSTDDSHVLLKNRYPTAILIRLKTNVGFAQGSNVGMRCAIEEGAELVLLICNDTIVHPLFLTELVKQLTKDKTIGMAGPMIYSYYEPNKIFAAGVKTDLWAGKAPLIGGGQIDQAQFDDMRYVDSLSGCAILIRKEVVENVGLLDPQFFCYWEEIDWCVRTRKAGYKLVFVPSAKMWHKLSATTRKIKGLKLYYLIRNRFLFVKRNGSVANLLSFSAYFFVVDVTIITASIIFVHKDLELFRVFLKAIRDGVHMQTGETYR